MSERSRQRQRINAKAQSQGYLNWRWPILGAALLSIFCAFAVWKFHERKTIDPVKATAGFKALTTFADLCTLPTNQLEGLDIALVNLLCADGLRGSENLNVKACLERLDSIAKRVQSETDRNYRLFREKPAEFNQSEGYYRMMMMVTVLQQDLGIRYNPERIRLPLEPQESNEEFFGNSEDVFIHGLTREKGTGTCSSMPVFFVSIGRRLGYPLKLVRAKGHLFARWDEGSRSFNIEGTSVGFVTHPDEHYRTWPFPFTAEEERTENYLQSLTPVQELATFASIRGHCCLATTNLRAAVGAFAQAFYKEPQSIGNQKLFAWAQRRAYEAGALPKRAALEIAIQSLEVPSGQMHDYFVGLKASLQAMLLRGQAEQEIELEIEAFKAEVANAKTIRKAP